MKRKIELAASMNANGYRVCVKINGREFKAHSRLPGNAAWVIRSIYDQLKVVYGDRRLFEQYVEYQDILGTMRVMGKIVEKMDRLYGCMEAFIQKHCIFAVNDKDESDDDKEEMSKEDWLRMMAMMRGMKDKSVQPMLEGGNADETT